MTHRAPSPRVDASPNVTPELVATRSTGRSRTRPPPRGASSDRARASRRDARARASPSHVRRRAHEARRAGRRAPASAAQRAARCSPRRAPRRRDPAAPRPPLAPHPGRAAERVDLEPGVVGDRRACPLARVEVAAPWRARSPRRSRMPRARPRPASRRCPPSSRSISVDAGVGEQRRAARAACPRLRVASEQPRARPRRRQRPSATCCARVELAGCRATARSSSASSSRAVEGAVLAGALHLHEAALAAHHDVHVDVGAHVLLVVEIEPRLAVDDADAHRGDAPPHGRRGDASRRAPSSRTHRRRRRAAPVIAAVRVPPSACEHVAVDLER